jgi:hypothetical protein
MGKQPGLTCLGVVSERQLRRVFSAHSCNELLQWNDVG